MTPAVLADLVRSFAGDVLTRRGLDPAALPTKVTVERPRNPEHGDYATTVALQTAAKAGVSARQFAGWLAEAVAAIPGVRCAEVAGPGFLNLRLDSIAHAEIIRQVLADGARFGLGDDPTGLIGPEFDPDPASDADPASDPASDPDADLASDPDADPDPWPGRSDVQYAHARLAALIRNAADLAVCSKAAPLELLEHEREGEVIRTIGEFPSVVALAARAREPRRLTRYLEQLADACHRFVETCRLLPMGDEDAGPRHGARLALARAGKQVLATGLGLLRVSAPERM